MQLILSHSLTSPKFVDVMNIRDCFENFTALTKCGSDRLNLCAVKKFLTMRHFRFSPVAGSISGEQTGTRLAWCICRFSSTWEPNDCMVFVFWNLDWAPILASKRMALPWSPTTIMQQLYGSMAQQELTCTMARKSLTIMPFETSTAWMLPPS